MTQEDQLSKLIQETRRRRRLKTNLSDFDEKLVEMMRLNISLPVIAEWLETQDKKTTVDALRRYIRRTFGEKHYDDFLKRNGWIKTKDNKEAKKAKQPINSFIGLEERNTSAAPVNSGVVEDESKDVGVSEIHKILSAPSQKYPARKK